MKTLKKGIALILTLMMVLSLGAFSVFADTSGTCGTSVTWTLDDDGKLTISGEGAMANYNPSPNGSAPWKSSPTSITSVEIGSGVASIGSWAFSGARWR